MKYRLINSEVFATQVTNENRQMFKNSAGDLPKVDDFVVTLPDGHVEFMAKQQFLKNYRPALLDDTKREMYTLCTQIIEQEDMLDDMNAEVLLANAAEIAKKLRKLIQ